MVDAAGTTSYSFTSFGAIQSEDGPWSSDTVTYSYDNDRRRIGFNLQAPNASDCSQRYGYDVAGNLTNRVQNLFTNFFAVNSLNELSNATRLGNMTVAGTTTRAATNLTVADNGNAAVAAIRYTNDNTFARTNVSLLNGANIFTAVGKDNYGRVDTNSVSPYLAATVSFSYDQNGNLLTDGRRFFEDIRGI